MLWYFYIVQYIIVPSFPLRARDGLSSIRWFWQGYWALLVAIIETREKDLTHGLWTESIHPLRPSRVIRRTVTLSSAIFHTAYISINIELSHPSPEVAFPDSSTVFRDPNHKIQLNTKKDSPAGSGPYRQLPHCMKLSCHPYPIRQGRRLEPSPRSAPWRLTLGGRYQTRSESRPWYAGQGRGRVAEQEIWWI